MKPILRGLAIYGCCNRCWNLIQSFTTFKRLHWLYELCKTLRYFSKFTDVELGVTQLPLVCRSSQSLNHTSRTLSQRWRRKLICRHVIFPPPTFSTRRLIHIHWGKNPHRVILPGDGTMPKLRAWEFGLRTMYWRGLSWHYYWRNIKAGRLLWCNWGLGNLRIH